MPDSRIESNSILHATAAVRPTQFLNTMNQNSKYPFKYYENAVSRALKSPKYNFVLTAPHHWRPLHLNKVRFLRRIKMCK